MQDPVNLIMTGSVSLQAARPGTQGARAEIAEDR